MSGSVVVVLDFRSERERPLDQVRLRDLVAGQWRQEGAAVPEQNLRFLLVDTPEGLTTHAEAYELVMGYPTLGTIQVLCLAVGELETPPEGQQPDGEPPREADPQNPPASRLRLVSALRSTAVGVLWTADPLAGDTTGPGGGASDTARAAALGILVDLLRKRELFDRVLGSLQRCPSATAAPALRALEHDLAAPALERAWLGALTRFTGEPGTAVPPLRAQNLPARLAELAGEGPRPALDRIHVHGGTAERLHRACAEALLRARQFHSELARPVGILVGRRSARQLAQAIEDSAQQLRGYRSLVARALRDSAAPSIPPGDAQAILAEVGIAVPPAEDGRGRAGAGQRYGGQGTTDQVEEEVNRFALGMLDDGLDLHTVAERLTALSEQIAPLPADGKIAELEQPSPEAAAVTVANAFRLARARPGSVASVAVLSLLGSIWPWPGTVLTLFPLAILFGGQLLAVRARPNRSRGGPVATAAFAQSTAAALGTAGGWALGHTVQPPSWLGFTTLLLATLWSVLLIAVRWARAVDDWWEGTCVERIGEGLESVDRLVVDIVRQQWWAAAERTRTADGARALAGALRSAVRLGAVGASQDPSAQDEWGETGAPGTEDRWGAEGWDLQGWDGDDAWPDEPWPGDPSEAATSGVPGQRRNAAPSGAFPTHEEGAAYADGCSPPWLDQGGGEGGPELERTLLGDLADATADALRRHWGAVDHGVPAAANGHPATADEAVRRGIDAVHRQLHRNGVLPAPVFARRDRSRGDSMALLGVGPHRVWEALVPESAGRRLRPLCSPAQLALLSRDPTAARLLRFAPAAVRPVLESDRSGRLGGDGEAALDDAVWMSSGRFVGVLELTPLRSGTVQTVWTRADEVAQDQPEERYRGGSSW
ncbi:hypothetical protein [Streptomyces albipurpureus]|uniref:Integral membrane protein n=1 Tax=Streptomyces albipurpureus TaxID=2897419 RepID=A0ABT0UJP0_9ACTN|nr:hypothetical protein [Streptomyces sp. CWNU-1]MCM2388842.1 hypothetical protein [Streptomyces sp. CWNU-1]